MLTPHDDSGPALVFAFRSRKLLLVGGSVPSVGALTPPADSHYLGRLGEAHCYCCAWPDTLEVPESGQFRDLLAVYGTLPASLAAIAGRAVQIVEWDRTHRFCGACATPTELSASARSRVCPACRLEQFPRLSPAIIVAVERGEEILLARGPHFPPGIYSVLAGFVDPGESAEEAVRREVHEETGMLVGDVRYFASQPWPFPHSLMLGFQATWMGGEMSLQEGEIEDAGFFHVDALPRMFPGRVSISQWLIEDFVRRHRGSR
ncbi:MAG: NAD(+) diphosphatase [Polyangiaceae bacterium]|nr:NAD(+) diphosphatase [Polyangiaceae bacterium]